MKILKTLPLALALCGGLSGFATARASSCDDLSATNDLFQCYVSEYEIADLQLNAVWKSIQDTFRHGVGGSETKLDALVKAQKVWIQLRDLDCAVAGNEMEGGSFEKVLVQSCLVSRTQERTAYLSRYVTH